MSNPNNTKTVRFLIVDSINQCINKRTEMINNYQFEKLARRKIAGWYNNKLYEDKAVARMASVRTEIIDLLASTEREGIGNVIDYLDQSGFFYRASSATKHHNFPGGLAEHSLGTYKLAQAEGARLGLPNDSVIIATLLHDTCKADRFWFKGRMIRQHTPKCEMDGRHSVRSVMLLKNCGLKLSEQERRAIRWHMKGEKYHSPRKNQERDHSKAIKEGLWHAVFYADKKDAAAHPAQRH